MINMNIALTGSSGSIGSLLSKDLKKAGHEVLSISSSKSMQHQNIFSYEEVILGKTDIKVDFIIHLASANSTIDAFQIDEEVDLAKKVLKSMDALACKNLIYFSSIKVYGEYSSGDKLFTEESLLEPKSPYGEAKRKCENFFIDMASIKNFRYIILRLPPMIIDNPSSNVGKFFYFIKRGLPIPSFLRGSENQKSFLTYENLFTSLELIFNNSKKINNGIFNLADPTSISTNSLLRKIGGILGKEPKIIHLPDFIFKFMMRVNILQSILNRIYGNFNVSSKKFKNTFGL